MALSNLKKEAYMSNTLQNKKHTWVSFTMRILTVCVSLDSLMRSSNFAVQMASLLVFLYSAVFVLMSISYIKVRSQLGWENEVSMDTVIDHLTKDKD